MNDDKDLYAGLIRLHILHHAVEAPIFGLGMIEELARHGYRLSAGTLYPILHTLERKGYLRSSDERTGARIRRVYRATRQGAAALAAAKQRVRELFGEMFESRRERSDRASSPGSARVARIRTLRRDRSSRRSSRDTSPGRAQRQRS